MGFDECNFCLIPKILYEVEDIFLEVCSHRYTHSAYQFDIYSHEVELSQKTHKSIFPIMQYYLL